MQHYKLSKHSKLYHLNIKKVKGQFITTSIYSPTKLYGNQMIDWFDFNLTDRHDITEILLLTFCDNWEHDQETT